MIKSINYILHYFNCIKVIGIINLMKCHFCDQEPIGVNYRPSPDLNNALAC